MNARAIFSVAFVSFFIMYSIDNANAIYCWRCSSDTVNGEFCGEPFNASNIGDQQKRWSYVDCGFSYGTDKTIHRAVCKKTRLIINDRHAVSRSCHWEFFNATKNECMNKATPSYIHVTFCETCSTDGCNGPAMDGVVENVNTTDETNHSIDEEKNVPTEISTAVSSKSDLSSDHEVLVTKNVTACNLGQDDSDEFVVELMIKIKKNKKSN